jgi:hypothetical protein
MEKNEWVTRFPTALLGMVHIAGTAIKNRCTLLTKKIVKKH